jgi:allophanate hydrolase subunit 2
MMSRMGLQLAEKLPDAATLPGMLSSPATRGHIQATPDGTLIVLQADAQPTGGYPLIGWVCEADQALLARLVPGDQVRFVLLTAEAAEALYLARAAFFRQLTAAIRVRYHFDQLRYGREFWGLDPGT